MPGEEFDEAMDTDVPCNSEGLFSTYKRKGLASLDPVFECQKAGQSCRGEEYAFQAHP